MRTRQEIAGVYADLLRARKWSGPGGIFPDPLFHSENKRICDVLAWVLSHPDVEGGFATVLDHLRSAITAAETAGF